MPKSSVSAALSAFLTILFAAFPANGDASQKAAAQALFEQGREHLIAGEVQSACEKLEASQKLDAGLGTLLYLAECYAQAGRTASAWASFLEAASVAKATGQTAREDVARQRAAEIAPTLSRLLIDASAIRGIPEVTLSSNGRIVEAASFGTTLPVDPGVHAIEARAPGREAFRTTVRVPPGPGVVRVTVPLLEEARRPAGIVDQRPPAQADRQAQASGHGTIGWLLTGIGVAGVAVGSIFGLRAIDRNHASLEACRTKTLCSEEGVKLRDEAQAAATLSTVGFAVGGLSLAGGIAVLVAEPAEQAARFDTGSSVSGLVLESATVSVGGSF